jgi:hypothetical protein
MVTRCQCPGAGSGRARGPVARAELGAHAPLSCWRRAAAVPVRRAAGSTVTRTLPTELNRPAACGSQSQQPGPASRAASVVDIGSSPYV